MNNQPSNALLKEIIGWDVRNWSGCLDFWSSAVALSPPSTGRILAVAERDGGLSLWFALHGLRVICSDDKGPTSLARDLHNRYGVSHLVTYADINVFDMPFPDGTFDIVAGKSFIGGLKLVRGDVTTRTLDNQRLAVQEINRVLKCGGVFLGAENLKGSWLHQRVRHLLKRGRIGWRHLTRAEIQGLFADFSLVEQKAYGFLGSNLTRLGLDRLTGFADGCISRLVPPDWLYISFIMARK